MKKIDVFETKDSVRHNSIEKAESHCLNKAHLILINILESENCQGSYKIATAIIKNEKNYALFNDLVKWLNNIINEEEINL